MNLKPFILITCLILFVACKPKPQPIAYGVDACHYCKMTIVDKVHGAEVVTKKNKVYKFDAAECMVRFLDEFDSTEISLYLTNTFTEPELLIDATQATYLISKNVPSPMGAFLSAFKTNSDAEMVKNDKGGKLFTWNTLLENFNIEVSI